MAQPTLLLLAAFILTCQPLVSEAGDVFTGFQIDNRSQYFGYFGVRTPLLQTSGGPDLFVQTLAAGIGYRFKSDGQLLDANVQFIVQRSESPRQSAAGFSRLKQAPNSDGLKSSG